MAEKEKKEKENWFKRNKVALIIGGGALALAAGALVVLKMKNGDLSGAKALIDQIPKTLPPVKEMDAVPLRTGSMYDKPWTEGGAVNSIIQGATVGSIGELGEDLMQLPDVTSETKVDAVIGLYNEVAAQ